MVGLPVHPTHFLLITQPLCIKILRIGVPQLATVLNSNSQVRISDAFHMLKEAHGVSGTSVSVFGLFSNISTGGNISATYSIDGNSTTQFVPMGSFDSVPMTRLFHADLQAGNHTLFVNVTSITSPRALGVDFIAYNSSVTSVAALPGYTPVQAASTNHLSSTSSSMHAWAITAIVLGVVLVLGLLLGGVLFARRRARRTEEKVSDPFFTRVLSRSSRSRVLDGALSTKHCRRQR